MPITTTTTRVIINITDTGGGGSPPIPDPEQGEDAFYLPTAYDSIDFFVEIEFLIETTTETESLPTLVNTSPATSVTSDFDFSQYDITFTKINDYTVRLEGPINNAFPDQFYEFVLSDENLTTAVLPPDTEEEFYSLIKYQKPANNSIELEYPFLINNTFNESLYHIIVWRFQSAVNNINDLVSRGLV